MLWLVHHDTKPIVGQHDSRRRPQRASGGGVFSIADNPIAVDHVDDDTRLLVPTAFKFCEAPEPITVTLQSGDGWLRLHAETGTAQNSKEFELHARIIEALKANPQQSGAALQKALKVRQMRNIRTGNIACKRCNIEAASCLVGDMAVCAACKQKSIRARMRSR